MNEQTIERERLQNFNSIKVRLELTECHNTCKRNIFQFHKGAIRTVTPEDPGTASRHFNSIKVRLEQG